MEFTPELDALRRLSYRVLSSQSYQYKQGEFYMAPSEEPATSSLELRLLIWCLSIHHPPGKHEVYPAFQIDDNFDWDHFLHLAIDRHRILGPVYLTLKQVTPRWLPAEVLSKLKKAYKKNALSLMQKTGVLIGILDRFDKEGIPALPLKGPFLGYWLYGNLTTRSFRDIDILIPKNKLLEVMQILNAMGYENKSSYHKGSLKQFLYVLKTEQHIEYIHPGTGIVVEIHWRLADFKIPALNFDQLWKKRQILCIGNRKFHTCHVNDMLVYLLIHGSFHNWRRLFWLNDINLLTQNYNQKNWTELHARLKTIGLEQSVLLPRQLLSTWYDKHQHENKGESFRQDTRSKFLNRLARTCILEEDNVFTSMGFMRRMKQRLGWLLLPDHLRPRITFLRILLFPVNFEYLNLPDRYFPVYFILRPYFWFFKHFTNISPKSGKKNR